MKLHQFFILFSGLISLIYGNISDSSDLLFNEEIVQEYRLYFYTKHWQDSLKYNFEDNDQAYMPARLEFGDITLDSVGVRYKGNSSYIGSPFPKKPFKIDFNEYKDMTFYGIDKINFANSYKDPSFMREKIGYDIIREYMPAPRISFANLYIEDELIGLYLQVEQIERSFLNRHFENNDFNLYKAILTSFRYWGKDQSRYTKKFELKTNENLNDWSALITMIDKLNNTPAPEFVDTMANYLNLNKCIRYLAFNMVLSNFDSYACSGRNIYLYDDSTSGQFYIIPWDLNMTFGTFSVPQWEDPVTQDIIDLPNLMSKPLMKRIVENDSLKQEYLLHIQKLIKGPCSYKSISKMTEEISTLIDKHVKKDDNKLYSYQDYIDNIENDIIPVDENLIPGIKSFSKERNEDLEKQLDKYLKDPIKKIPEFDKSINKPLFLDNFPSPFFSYTTIVCKLNNLKIPVEISVYNNKGRKVAMLYNGMLPSKMHKFQWDASGMSPGFYLIQVTAGNLSYVKNTLLLK